MGQAPSLHGRDAAERQGKKIREEGRERGEMGKPLFYLRTGCVLNSEMALISPMPLPLTADSRIAYLVSGFRPTTVITPSMLAVPERKDTEEEQ